jgi:putative copper export protein
MHLGQFLGAAVVFGILFFQVFVTYRVWKTNVFERAQKVAQARLIWLLPMLGAVIVFSVLTDEERFVAKAESGASQHQQ